MISYSALIFVQLPLKYDTCKSITTVFNTIFTPCLLEQTLQTHWNTFPKPSSGKYSECIVSIELSTCIHEVQHIRLFYNTAERDDSDTTLGRTGTEVRDVGKTVFQGVCIEVDVMFIDSAHSCHDYFPRLVLPRGGLGRWGAAPLTVQTEGQPTLLGAVKAQRRNSV